MDPFAARELPPGAPPDEIAATYRRLAKRWHPDRGGGEAAAARMAEINVAYDVLRSGAWQRRDPPAPADGVERVSSLPPRRPCGRGARRAAAPRARARAARGARAGRGRRARHAGGHVGQPADAARGYRTAGGVAGPPRPDAPRPLAALRRDRRGPPSPAPSAAARRSAP